MIQYKSVVLTKRGGPEMLQIQERELVNPKSNQVQIKVLACGVGRTDIAMRYGYYPFAPKIPFVPGYEIVGEVTAVGQSITKFKIGNRVAALTVYGGYSEYIYLDQDDLVIVPDGLDPAQVVTCVLNYTTAYQMLHRVAKVQSGESMLVIGASGGVGSALLELGQSIGLKMYGIASAGKRKVVEEKGGIHIDYTSVNVGDYIKRTEPNGVNYVFDGVGGDYIRTGMQLLGTNGMLVEYGYPGFWGMLKGILKISWLNFISMRKKAVFYGISAEYRKSKESIHTDIKTLMEMLKSNQINPLIDLKLSLLEAQKANFLLESGAIFGKVVLLKKL